MNMRTNTISAERIISFVLSLYHPSSVIDVGASGGIFLLELMKRDVKDVMGIDGPWIPDKDIVIPKRNYLRIDLTKPFTIERKFDLCICLEVLEHLNWETGELLLRELTSLSDVILFSAAVPGQGGTHHVNEQWPSFWAKEFRKYGFKYIDIRPYIWNDKEILPWYKQNMMIYLKDQNYDNFINKLKAFKRKEPLSVIHPDMSYVSLLSLEKNLLFSRSLFLISKLLAQIARTYTIHKKLQMEHSK
ncbi:MAG: hypothetical protein AAE977_03225 [Thermoplasmataceae archaeon]